MSSLKGYIMRRGLNIQAGLIIVLIVVVTGCKQSTTPKPRGYFRITFPEHEYALYQNNKPYTFEASTSAKVIEDPSPNAEQYWLNIGYPQHKGVIHFSYKAIENNLSIILEDSRGLAYKHSIKADAIGERVFASDENKTYGILYDIKGDAASSLQFFLTDSAKHFIRGSLYFDVVPNKDSLAPVIDYIKEDVMHLMETLKWEE